MNVPMAKEEIADFLNISLLDVENLWGTERLQRTWTPEFRDIKAFSQSTIFDVIEYALTSGALNVTLSCDLAALWVVELAEVVDCSSHEFTSVRSMIDELNDCARFEGLDLIDPDSAKTARQIATSHYELVEICSS